MSARPVLRKREHRSNLSKPLPPRAKHADKKLPPCSIQATCRSCQFVNTDYKEGLNKKFHTALKVFEDQDLVKGVRISKPVASPKVFSYRSTAKLAVRELNGNIELGLFQPGSHNIVDLSSCPIHARPLKQLIYKLKDHLNDTSEGSVKLKAWDESTLSGDLRYVVARCSEKTDDIQLTFVVPNMDKRRAFRDLIRLLRVDGFKISSAFMNVNSDNNNRIFGDAFHRISGIDHLRLSFNGLDFHVNAGSFLQINQKQAELMYRRIADIAGDGGGRSIAWDLYCGMGPISLTLAESGYRVFGIEENPQAVSDAQQNAVRNNFTSAQAEFVQGKTEEKIKDIPLWAVEPTLIMANPSRTGIDDRAKEEIASRIRNFTKLDSFIYMSCNHKSLASDLKFFKEQGIKVRQLEAFDMFPHTDHLEWIAVLTR